MKDTFEFNHIDNSLSESDIKTLKDFFSHYYGQSWPENVECWLEEFPVVS